MNSSTSEGSPQESDRRRSQRVVATETVQVTWTTVEGWRAAALATTKNFNAHGALLDFKAPIALPSEVELSRPDGDETIPARVVDASTFAPNARVRVTVEFAAPSETFWGIATPPPPSNTAS